jgi:hypothetical protein
MNVKNSSSKRWQKKFAAETKQKNGMKMQAASFIVSTTISRS